MAVPVTGIVFPQNPIVVGVYIGFGFLNDDCILYIMLDRACRAVLLVGVAHLPRLLPLAAAC